MEGRLIYAMDRKCGETAIFLGVPRYLTLNYNAVYVTGLVKKCFVIFYF